MINDSDVEIDGYEVMRWDHDRNGDVHKSLDVTICPGSDGLQCWICFYTDKSWTLQAIYRHISISTSRETY